MREFIIGISVQDCFDKMLSRLEPDPETGYDRDFWTVFEEYINADGLHDDIHDEDGAELIATRKWLQSLSRDWMAKIDEANDNLKHAMRCRRLRIPE